MKPIINQQFGNSWAFYNADCVYGMENLPGESIDFSVFSPPFLALYIYSDNNADLGNTDSEDQFFEGWKYHLEELFRVLKTGKRIAIHCKDTMRYMSGHGYAGLYDFPGEIIRLCEAVGFNYERWITIWKDPVVEMQRTKTYGLLHKSFEERAEVTRQGCADFVLVFSKGGDVTEDPLPPLNKQAVERCIHQWTNEGENIFTPFLSDIRGRVNAVKNLSFSLWHEANYSQELIEDILDRTQIGRLATVHCTAQMLRDIVLRFESVEGWKFHSRVTLTDGSFFVTFRNWLTHPENNIVKHHIQCPEVDYQKFEIVETFAKIVDGDMEIVKEEKEIWREPILRGNEEHFDYVGIDAPVGWRDRKYYSILVWQRYASPVWFDFEGFPRAHSDSWMDIVQTNVLNFRQSKTNKEEKHICPLQLDLIEKLIYEYTKPGDVVLSPYGGIGSEPYQAVKLNRKAIAFELKPEYWEIGCKNLFTAEKEILQEEMSF